MDAAKLLITAYSLGSLTAHQLDAETGCFPPVRPMILHDQATVLEFRDLIREDFERYFTDAQVYFLCLDQEKLRLTDQAKTVAEEYRDFLTIEPSN